MCSSLLSCPLCCLSSFPDLETFKLNLIKVNSKPMKCPFPNCNEILLGLDKLTIHLFGHSLPNEIQTSTNTNNIDLKSSSSLSSSSSSYQPQQQKVKRNDSTPKVTKQTRMKLVKSTTQMKASTDESFRCEICGFIFYDENLLNLHLSLVHNFTPNSNDVDNDEDDATARNEIKKFQCHLCSKHFKMKGKRKIINFNKIFLNISSSPHLYSTFF
jgi:KRAB domain-containing zinc finger protein